MDGEISYIRYGLYMTGRDAGAEGCLCVRTAAAAAVCLGRQSILFLFLVPLSLPLPL